MFVNCYTTQQDCDGRLHQQDESKQSNSTSILHCHSLECIASYYIIEWLGSGSGS